jgi:hypothetical protein
LTFFGIKQLIKLYLLNNIQNEIPNEETQNRETALLNDLTETKETSSKESDEEDEMEGTTNERRLVTTQWTLLSNNKNLNNFILEPIKAKKESARELKLANQKDIIMFLSSTIRNMLCFIEILIPSHFVS